MSQEMKFRWLCLMNSTPGDKIKSLGVWSWKILSLRALKAGGHCIMVPGWRLPYSCHLWIFKWRRTTKSSKQTRRKRKNGRIWPIALVERILIWIVMNIVDFFACFRCSPGGRKSILVWTGLVSIPFVKASSLANKLTKLVNSHFAYCTPYCYLFELSFGVTIDARVNSIQSSCRSDWQQDTREPE